MMRNSYFIANFGITELSTFGMTYLNLSLYIIEFYDNNPSSYNYLGEKIRFYGRKHLVLKKNEVNRIKTSQVIAFLTSQNIDA